MKRFEAIGVTLNRNYETRRERNVSVSESRLSLSRLDGYGAMQPRWRSLASRA